MNRRRFIQHLGAWTLGLGLGGRLHAAADDDTKLREAIGRRRCVRFTYAGHVRWVEPHALGVTAGGHRALLAWQFAGTGRSQPPTGWRTFWVAEILGLQPTGREFAPRADYRREKSTLRDIECDVHTVAPAGEAPTA